jgi:hypothetical protein
MYQDPLSGYVQSITAVPLNIALSFLQVRNLETYLLPQLRSLPCDASDGALQLVYLQLLAPSNTLSVAWLRTTTICLTQQGKSLSGSIDQILDP